MKNKDLNKKRAYIDPIHGVIEFPFEIVHQLIDHPYLQRLRRITQCGLSNYVFPGANHTRFHHTVGVAHLASVVVQNLIKKGVNITPQEHEATCLAALIHDIGHGPYSHALEQKIIPLHHEEISMLIANKLNEVFEGKLDQAILILKNKHPKKYLSQIIASQLDVDRLDYLRRDGFYTGVSVANLDEKRLINTFNVHNEQLVVEEKAIQSVEKFLVTRHHMYWQVYNHKTVLAIQNMLILLVERIRYLLEKGIPIQLSQSLKNLMMLKDFEKNSLNFLEDYLNVDDNDFLQLIKENKKHPDNILSYLCMCILDRKIFKIKWISSRKKRYLFTPKRPKPGTTICLDNDESIFLIRYGEEISSTYVLSNEILILTSKGECHPLSRMSQIKFKEEYFKKSFVCYPRLLEISSKS